MAKSSNASPTPKDAAFDRRYLLLGLVPVAVYLVFYLVLDRARPTGIAFEILAPSAFGGAAAEEAHLRYLWISAFLLSGGVSLAVAVSCGLSLWGETPRRDRRLIFTFVTTVAAVFIAVEMLPDLPGQKRWYDFMGENLYRSVFGRVPADPDARSPLGLLDSGLDLVKAFGSLALTLVATALILTLVRHDRAEAPERRADHLARASARQRSYLQQGAAVYVFALVAMLSWMYWPLPFLADEAARAAYRQLVVGAAVVQGVGYSLGIAAIYLPPALLLRRRIVALAGEASDDDAGAEDWLRDKGLETQPLDQLRQAAALLMPVLVSILPALTELWQ